jgi:hypothetical protein
MLGIREEQEDSLSFCMLTYLQHTAPYAFFSPRLLLVQTAVGT